MGLTKNYEGEMNMPNDTSIGCVIETPSFYPYMTGYDNLKYAATLNNVSVDRILETTELLGLKDALNKKVKGYSLGMRQRLGIAAALLRNPKLLILDEPTNGLDPAGIHELREYIKDIAVKKNITVLISSHILSELEKICDEAIIVQHGRIIDKIDINEFRANSESILTIGTSKVEEAASVFNENNIKVVNKTDKNISVSMGDRSSEDIIDILNKNDIRFVSVYEEKQSLEEVFLNLVKENNIV